MNKNIRQLIARYETQGDFTRPKNACASVREAEAYLGQTLPKQYADFIEEYGHGGIGGVEVLGIGCNGELVFVEETLECRKYGLPSQYVVIENCDEWIYCIDCVDESVVVWQQNEPVSSVFSSFDEYLLERFNEAIENI